MGALAYRRRQEAQGAEAQGMAVDGLQVPLSQGEGGEPEAEAEAGREAEQILNVVRSRHGAVLGRETMLKSDHCPGCQGENLQERIEGAPNFRGVPGFRVYGVANPTAEGIRSVLERVGARRGGGGRRVVWHNMREEATVYINGKPFVLREAQRPFKNMKEYSVGHSKSQTPSLRPRS